MFTKDNKDKLAKAVWKALDHNQDESVAHAYAITLTDQSNITCSKIASAPDVYDLLESTNVKGEAILSDGLAVITCGWAAPVSHDGTPPSESKERKRVRLIIIVDSNKKIVSALKMQDDNDIMIDDSGSGALADALTSLY